MSEGVSTWTMEVIGGTRQILIKSADDLRALKTLDPRAWAVMSIPTNGVAMDRGFLDAIDTDGDGRIRIPEVLAAIERVESVGIPLETLFDSPEKLDSELHDTEARLADLEKDAPTEEDVAALKAWEAKRESLRLAALNGRDEQACQAITRVEGLLDAYFEPPEETALVIENPVVKLSLTKGINPRYEDDFAVFREECLKPLTASTEELTRADWRKMRAAIAPFRAHMGTKPISHAAHRAELEARIRLLHIRRSLVTFLADYVNTSLLFDESGKSMALVGALRIDGRQMALCFHVENEAAHSALSGRSGCCVLYARATRPATHQTRAICAVVTAGSIGRLYVGRNGIFVDRDGVEWEAMITKVVEAQVSLMEAFWAPWKRIGESVASFVKKFLGDRQTKATAAVTSGTKDAQATGAALASSVAAIGIGIGMAGAALASLMAVVNTMSVPKLLLSLVVVILLVSLPSVILTWFKLRRRDLGAVLNAGGWAVNRPLLLSAAKAACFTSAAQGVKPVVSRAKRLFWAVVVGALLGAVAAFVCIQLGISFKIG